jgi:DNA-binding YbaB/EbfC family protein
MRSLMKQAQQMQQRLAEAREKLEAESAEATAGGGMVAAVVNGRHELLSLKIKPEAVDPNDVEMLEDMILAAVNEAGRRITERISAEMAKLTGGLGMPGMF